MNLFSKLIAAIAASVPEKSEGRKKPWQDGKPWCTKYVDPGKLLWNTGTYVYEKHGPLR